MGDIPLDPLDKSTESNPTQNGDGFERSNSPGGAYGDGGLQIIRANENRTPLKGHLKHLEDSAPSFFDSDDENSPKSHADWQAKLDGFARTRLATHSIGVAGGIHLADDWEKEYTGKMTSMSGKAHDQTWYYGSNDQIVDKTPWNREVKNMNLPEEVIPLSFQDPAQYVEGMFKMGKEDVPWRGEVSRLENGQVEVKGEVKNTHHDVWVKFEAKGGHVKNWGVPQEQFDQTDYQQEQGTQQPRLDSGF